MGAPLVTVQGCVLKTLRAEATVSVCLCGAFLCAACFSRYAGAGVKSHPSRPELRCAVSLGLKHTGFLPRFAAVRQVGEFQVRCCTVLRTVWRLPGRNR